MSKRRMRPSVAMAVTAALVASSIASVTLAAGPSAGTMARGASPTVDGGGSTTGASACSIQVAASTGGFASNVAVVPLEEFTVAAQGYAPNGEGELTANNTDQGIGETFNVVFSADGRLEAPFFFTQEGHGLWLLTLGQDDPACSAQAEIDVLPLDDVVRQQVPGGHQVAVPRGHHVWLHIDHVLPGGPGDARPDGDLPRAGAEPAGDEHRLLHR